MNKNTVLNLQQPEIGELIRSLRQELKLTQEQFAGMVGVVFTTVNRWEKGHAHPSPMAMKIIVMKLNELEERGERLLGQYYSVAS